MFLTILSILQALRSYLPGRLLSLRQKEGVVANGESLKKRSAKQQKRERNYLTDSLRQTAAHHVWGRLPENQPRVDARLKLLQDQWIANNPGSDRLNNHMMSLRNAARQQCYNEASPEEQEQAQEQSLGVEATSPEEG